MEENIKKNENINSDKDLEENEENSEEILNEDLESEDNNLEENYMNDKEEEIEELKNSLSRLQADFINFKNRTERERTQSIALANERLILNLLPVTGAEIIGRSRVLPKKSKLRFGFFALCIVFILNLTLAKSETFDLKVEAVKDPPIPGTSPEHATPSHTGQTLQ